MYLVLFLTQTTISESRNLQRKIPQIAKKSVYFDLSRSNEVIHSISLTIDSRKSSTGTSNSPRNNTDMLAIEGHWATRISLARILSSFTSTQHDISDDSSIASICAIASGIINVGDRDHSQCGRSVATFGGGSPSGDFEHITITEATTGGKTDSSGIAISDRFSQSQDTSIIGNSA